MKKKQLKNLQIILKYPKLFHREEMYLNLSQVERYQMSLIILPTLIKQAKGSI
jgi:hypothetical protein